MSLPKARTVPTAIIAKPRPTQDALSGFVQPPPTDAGAFVPASLNNDRQTAPSPPQSELAALPPNHLYELGLTTAAMGYHTAALEVLGECTTRAPTHAPAWRTLAKLLRLAGRDAEADAADEAAERTSSDPRSWEAAKPQQTAARLEEAERTLRQGLQGRSPGQAAATLREHLVVDPLDVAAIRLLVQLERLAGDTTTCLWLLERALELCPDYIGAREDYAALLVDLHIRGGTAAAQTALLLAHDARNARYRFMHAMAMMHIGNFETALDVWLDLLRENPGDADYWLQYAHVLRFLGRRDECMQAFRHCLELQPDMGEAWWGLADLKGNFITDDGIAAIRAQLEGDDADLNDRMHMLYALGQSLERSGDFPASFAAYDEGARAFRAKFAQRRKAGDDEDDEQPESVGRLRRLKKVFSRENVGTKLVPAPVAAIPDTPIFVIGMPRAGSTLVEQILSSHSQVEGTRELPLIGEITRELSLSRILVTKDAYPECVLDLAPGRLAELGARVIESSRAYRKTGRPYFIDKGPWNWLDVGLIHLILPHARIIDVRRKPMAACFAMFKQLLPNRCAFSYDFDELGRYFNRYVSLMEHWESVLPGRVHFVQYETLVEDAENQIRRLLDYCGLPFEEGCLHFWQSDRAVATPSAEQVRRPIYRDAVEQWRNFEPWLRPLKEALDEPVDV